MKQMSFDNGKEFTKALFDDFAKDYHKDMGIRQTATGDVEFFLKQVQSIKNGKILDVGCGDGRIAIPLIKAGHQVDGVEPSGEMLKILRRRLTKKERARNKFYKSGFLEWGLTNKRYDMAILAFDVLYHFGCFEEQLTAIRNCACLLDKGGKVIIDVFRQKYESLAKYRGSLFFDYVSDDTIRYKTISSDLDEQINMVNYFYFKEGDVEIKHNPLRWVSYWELYLMLLHAGFSKIKCFGDYRETPAKYSHDRMIFIAEKE